MELVINQVYDLSGWIFDDYALKSNNNKFVYVGSHTEEGTEVAAFRGLENNLEQWATHETLMEDEDVNCRAVL